MRKTGPTKEAPPMPAAEESDFDVRALRDAVQAAVDELHGTLATLQIAVVDGYFVKVWQDWDSGEWVADCPTVRTVAQESTREEALSAIRTAIRGMLTTLADADLPVPRKEV